ncbi:alpha/beta fold hydrolase [Actinoplanes regularis]|uniref:Pimeloyl-ACP methyl ester carboxylesterase n=1 Tax=Actinoplanes regularis TaxID=52697 RepID=A0A239AV74_9ACTN|nr:alpha/beta hydrolase [Actinoplanes regularis]GIE87342.1 alpha/beta hydrolase [Actinoplanes regularis]SNR99480.1 Pimeloyl-ACP methyl ester carboxylesterase [Actinoplanes regularis]
MATGLRVLHGGHGDPVLLLLHGLGGTADVWNGWSALLERRWPGRWVAPDLPGHGGSAPLARYTFDDLAAAVAEVIPPDQPTFVAGHSLGGVVALALAARLPTTVRGVVGLGVKVAWSDEELQRAQALAARPRAWFPTRDEAAARYLRVAGLDGLLAIDDPAVDAGLVRQDDRWGTALDPAAFGVGRPDLPGLLAACRAPVILARGAHDPMNTDEQLAALNVTAVTLAEVGHSAHVQDPELTYTLLERLQR